MHGTNHCNSDETDFLLLLCCFMSTVNILGHVGPGSAVGRAPDS